MQDDASAPAAPPLATTAPQLGAAPQAPHLSHWPARLPRTLELPQTSLWFNLEVSAKRFPHKAAYRFFGAELSFSQLHADALALAGWLQAQGLQAGERVAVYLQNCPQFATACYAVWRANGVVVPINPMNRAEELRHCLADSGARLLVAAAEAWPQVQGAQAALAAQQQLRHVLLVRYADALPAAGVLPEEAAAPAMMAWLQSAEPAAAKAAAPAHDGPAFTLWNDALHAGLPVGEHRAGPEDLALLPYTSGTTGHPKACMHPHRSLMHNACGGAQWGHGGPESVNLGVVPMFHITGFMYGVLTGVFTGATTVLLPRWDRELAGRLISRHRVTHWTCIPTMVIDLFGSPNYSQFDLSSLRYLSGGGAAMPAAVAQRLKDEFGLVFAEGYGLTETAAPSHANPPERAKPQCLGMPIFGVDSRVVDPLSLQALPPGVAGEIIVHGPMVFEGYWQQPEATTKAFAQIDGKRFFRTGDLGRIDEEGYFFITDRLKRMINASGYKVWPSEVELLLYQCPLVQEACIIAAKDAYRGETVKAVIVLRASARAGTTAEDIIAWARDHMAAYKVPRIVQFVDALPKSGSGKVMWRLLQEEEAAAAAAATATAPLQAS